MASHKQSAEKKSAEIIVLETTQGSFAEGFTISIDISERGKAVHKTIPGTLPPAPDLPQLYQQWRSVYLDDYFRIILPEAQVKNVASAEKRRDAGDALIGAMQAWLRQDPVKELEYALRDELGSDSQAQVILKTEDELLQRLPWHRWSLFRRYDKLALALHAAEPPASIQQMCWPVRILVILGNTGTGSDRGHIDVQEDLRLIKSLPRTTVEVLSQPNRQAFSDALRDRRGWDIVFFAGHSESRETSKTAGRPDGILQLNPEESLSLRELSKALKAATQRGLKLLILNSCDGLGLAHSIARVGIPYQVVMREPVPDKVAHGFLRYFLDSFAHGEPLHRSLRIARDRLDEVFRQEFPSASWLPVVCQHPSAPLLCWPRGWQPTPKIKVATAVGLVGVAAVGLLAFGGGRKLFQGSNLGGATVPDLASGYPNLPQPALDISQGADILFKPSNLSALQSQIMELQQQGAVAFEEGEAAQAKGEVEAAIAQFEQASAQFEQVLALQPNSPEALIYKNNAQNKVRQVEPITLGVPLPMAADPNAALEIMRGVAQAQEEINRAGGIEGQPLQILLADDEDNPAIAQRIAQDFSDSPDVVAVIGSNTSDSSLATLDAYREGKLPVISPTSTATELSDASPYFFRTVPNDAVAAQVLAEYALETLQVRQAAIYYNPSSRYSQSLREAFEQTFTSADGKVVDIVDASASDFNPELNLALATQKGADVIVLLPNHQVLERAADVLSANRGRLPVLGGDGLYSPKILSLAKENAVGTVVSVPWHIDNSPDPEFPGRSRSLWGGATVNWRSAMAYDAVLAIAQAAQNKPTRSGIQRALSSRRFQAEGASGLVEFARGDRTSSTQLVEIVSGEQIDQPQFVPVRAAAESEP